MSQKVKTSIGVIIILIIIATVWMFIGVYEKGQLINGFPISQDIQAKKKNNQKACTMEAKICPDGSSVSRTGPKCEFAPCPGGSISDCAKEGESIGAVAPGVKLKQCCEGLSPVIPKNMVGTQGICTKTNK